MLFFQSKQEVATDKLCWNIILAIWAWALNLEIMFLKHSIRNLESKTINLVQLFDYLLQYLSL